MIKAIVTDIEGTTSSLSFVKDTLFPYARANIADYVRQNRQQAEVARLLDDVSSEAGVELDTEGLIAQLIDWIDQDRKVTALKTLQGMIWEAGYRKGDFKGHVYTDAVDQLRAWKAKQIVLYVYSSGSVYAQKLLFAHTDYGDLTPLFNDYFDTHIGGKKEVTSYKRIAENIGLEASTILFLSDIKEELDAAKAAGLNTGWLVRDLKQIDEKAVHRQARNFDEIIINGS
jgi:enolase-phosphatase E1